MLALSRNLGNGVPQMEFLKKYALSMLAQPSSAPIERVFSMLQTVVADHATWLDDDVLQLPRTSMALTNA